MYIYVHLVTHLYVVFISIIFVFFCMEPKPEDKKLSTVFFFIRCPCDLSPCFRKKLKSVSSRSTCV